MISVIIKKVGVKKKSYRKKTKREKQIKMILFICILFVFCLIAFWNQPIYRNYTLTTDKINNNIKIVHLSDLHSCTYGKNQKRLISKIDKAKPDIIVLTGDIIDDIQVEDNAYILMRDLVEKYPVYYVDGNHEVWHQETEKLYKEINDIGVCILDNTYKTMLVNGEEIVLAGIMDPLKWDQNTSESTMKINLKSLKLESANSDLYTILLTHRPEYAKLYESYPIDLALAGHAHGGQVRIPFLLNGLFAPDQGFKPEYAGGYYQLNSYELIVSRGLSLNLKLPRVFNPPEVVVIQINGGKNDN